MTLILYTHDKLESSLSHGAILCTQEIADNYYLMHYRTRGSKNGVRRFQDENGRLTEEGYQHYAEMYGWNKKTNKARHLQDNADKAFQKSDAISKKLDKATLDANYARSKSNYAQAKNDRKPTERRQHKAEVLSDKAGKAEAKRDQLKNDLDISLAKARLTQDKATNYNDKLARKDERMSKYVDENGNLNEKALEKYTYSDGASRKMSLVGRIKFGNEYSKKFEKDYAQQLQQKEQERAKQAADLIDKRIAGFDSKPDDPQHKRMTIDSLSQQLKAINDGEIPSTVDRRNSLKTWLDEKITEEKQRTKALIDTRLNGYDSMSAKSKQKLGEDVLEALAATNRSYQDNDPDFEKMSNDLQSWLIDRVYEKSGSINAADYKPGSKAYAAEEKANATWKQMSDREDQIKKDIGYSVNNLHDKKYLKESKRLQEALQKDSVWKDLSRLWNSQENDVMGAILQDLGFTDNPRNRSILYSYGWFD